MSNKPMDGEQYNQAYYDGGKTWYKGLGMFLEGPGNLRDSINNVQQVRHFFPNMKTNLDVGCGKGIYVAAARMMGIVAHGIEISDYALGQAPEHVRPYLHKYDGLEVPLKLAEPKCGDEACRHKTCVAKWDVISSMFVLEHIPLDDLKVHLTNMEKYVSMGMVFRVPVIPPWQTREDYMKYEQDPTHVTIEKLDFWLELIPSVTDLVFAASWFTNTKGGGSRATLVFKTQAEWDADMRRDPFFAEV